MKTNDEKINFRDPNWREPREHEIIYLTRRAEVMTNAAQLQPGSFAAKSAAAAWDRVGVMLSDMADLAADPENWGPASKVPTEE